MRISDLSSDVCSSDLFGLTTALNYAFSGLVDWPLATVFIIGGFAGGFAGAAAAKSLYVAGHLSTVFAGMIIVFAAYMLWKSAVAAFCSRSHIIPFHPRIAGSVLLPRTPHTLQS